MKTLLLSESQVKSLVSMKEIIDIVDKTFADLGRGETLNPSKLNLNLGDSQPTKLPYKASLNAMPAYIGWQDIAGLKWAGGYGAGRKALGLPFINALIMLVDPDIGNFLTVMDGTWITTMRTGAQSAAILKYLIPEKKKISIGMYGAGVQGRAQTTAISTAFELEKLYVYDPNKEAAKQFKADMQDVVQGDIVIANEPYDASQADALITVTPATEPFLKGEWLDKGSIYLAEGSYQECDEQAILGADYLVVDNIGQALHRGNLKKYAELGKVTEETVYATVPELAAGLKSIPNRAQSKVLVAPIGMGCLDVAVAGIVYKKAFSLGMGGEFVFDDCTKI